MFWSAHSFFIIFWGCKIHGKNDFGSCGVGPVTAGLQWNAREAHLSRASSNLSAAWYLDTSESGWAGELAIFQNGQIEIYEVRGPPRSIGLYYDLFFSWSITCLTTVCGGYDSYHSYFKPTCNIARRLHHSWVAIQLQLTWHRNSTIYQLPKG